MFGNVTALVGLIRIGEIQEQKHAAHMLQACGLGSTQASGTRQNCWLVTKTLSVRCFGLSNSSVEAAQILGMGFLLARYPCKSCSREWLVPDGLDDQARLL